MHKKEFIDKINELKQAANECIRTEIMTDRMQTAITERKAARQEMADALANIERIELEPDTARTIARYIAAIDRLRAEKTTNAGRREPPSQAVLEQLATEHSVSIAEVETLVFAVRYAGAVERLVAMKPQIVSALMGENNRTASAHPAETE